MSLFASDGALTGAFYLFCEADLSIACSSAALNPPYPNIGYFFGTSAASPYFAGIMALLDQKAGSRQGNANYVLYKLAAEQSPANCDSSTGRRAIASSMTLRLAVMSCPALQEHRTVRAKALFRSEYWTVTTPARGMTSPAG